MAGPEAAGPPSKVTDEALLAAVPAARNMRQLLVILGVAPYGGNYEIMRSRLVRLGVDDPRFQSRPRSSYKPPVLHEDLVRCVALADSYAQATRMLGLGESSAAQRRVKRLAQDAELDTSHFLGQRSSRGLRLGGKKPEAWETLLVCGRLLSTNGLRKRLVAEGLLPRECATCGRYEWEGAPIPLELDHINGDRTDNRLVNLRLLCPNCHAQTDTYRGRNIGAMRAAADTAKESPGSPELRRAAAQRRLLLVLDRGGGIA